MRFPTQETAIAGLAMDIASGLEKNTEVFPAPPAGPEELRAALSRYREAHETAMDATAAAEQGTAAKNDALESLTDLMKSVLRYAENTTKFDAGKLKLLGWGGRAERTSLEAPGAARALEILGTGEGWVMLDWKRPKDGGPAAAYRVQRRRRDDGTWKDVGMAVESEVILSDQERGTEVDYRVLAVNKAGESTPSPIVTVLL